MITGALETKTMRALVAAGLLLGLAGCSAAPDVPDADNGEVITGSDETGTTSDALTGAHPAGSELATTANLNLRSGPSTGDHIILVMPTGASVTLVDASPTGYWYHVHYGAYTGWAYGSYLRLVSSGGGGSSSGGGTSGGGSSAVDAVIARARSGVGFSYWWGHGAWLSGGPTGSTAGYCSGSCPSCTHSGHYGADCSGFVAKVWSVPSSNSTLSSDDHPYSTWNFYNTTGGGQWSHISRSSVRRGDALTYNSGSEGHIVLFESGDPWGSMWTYEARGCATGIVHNIRTAGSAYIAVRRAGL